MAGSMLAEAFVSGPVWGLVPVALGLFCGAVVVRFLAKVRAARAWRSTTGTITKSGVQSKWRVTGILNYSLIHELQVEYGYEVDGCAYTGRNVTFGTVSSSLRRWEERKAARYAVGQGVEVWYDPDKPSDSVLDRRFGALYLTLPLLLGIGLLILGILTLAGVIDL